MASRIGETKWVKVAASEVEVVERDPGEAIAPRGQWGDVVSDEVVQRKVPVLGLSLAKIADAKASAKFSYSLKGQAGFKFKVFVVGAEASVAYTLTQDLELEAAAGESLVESLNLPFRNRRVMFKPTGSAEWFEVSRYAPEPIDPRSPGLGTVTDLAAPGQLKRRDAPPKTLGGGSGPTKSTISQELAIAVSIELEIGFGDDKVNPVTAGSIGVSAGIEGTVSTELAYDLPARAGAKLYWLSGLAGADIASR